MGQYFLAVNIDKKQYLDPRKFKDGNKFGEFAFSSFGMMSGMALLLADGDDGYDDRGRSAGTWAGDRIVIAGDYGKKGKFMKEKKNSEVSLFKAVQVDNDYLDISGNVLQDLKLDSYAKKMIEGGE